MEIPETQQKILNSAKRWFLEKGFKSAPLRKIVNDVGFTRALLLVRSMATTKIKRNCSTP